LRDLSLSSSTSTRGPSTRTQREVCVTTSLQNSVEPLPPTTHCPNTTNINTYPVRVMYIRVIYVRVIYVRVIYVRVIYVIHFSARLTIRRRHSTPCTAPCTCSAPYSRLSSRLTAHGSRLTAHGSRLTAHGSLLTAHCLYNPSLYNPPQSPVVRMV